MVETCLRKVLLIGEGNFSYALARARASNGAMHLVATSFDSLEELYKKYPESVEILKKLKELPDLKVDVFHRVDATNIHETLPI